MNCLLCLMDLRSTTEMSKNNTEAIYPLSPMQQGMLFHTLYAPQTGVYIQQLNYALTGNLDVPAFERAWLHVVERHQILRTLFVWEHLDKPKSVRSIWSRSTTCS